MSLPASPSSSLRAASREKATKPGRFPPLGARPPAALPFRAAASAPVAATVGVAAAGGGGGGGGAAGGDAGCGDAGCDAA
eukprot:scaffold53991_cov69-Phaeocystis_antarctica.AAC.1